MRSIVSQTYTHTITGSDIWLEAEEITRALAVGGYDTTSLDLENLAIQVKVREVRDTTEYFNITVEQLHWAEPNHYGDVEMQITVPTDADLVMLRLALC
jgi:hypothetical protein